MNLAISLLVLLNVCHWIVQIESSCLVQTQAGSMLRAIGAFHIGHECNEDSTCEESVCHSVEGKCGQSIFGSTCTRDNDCVSLACQYTKCVASPLSYTPLHLCKRQEDCNQGSRCLLFDGTGRCVN